MDMFQPATGEQNRPASADSKADTPIKTPVKNLYEMPLGHWEIPNDFLRWFSPKS